MKHTRSTSFTVKLILVASTLQRSKDQCLQMLKSHVVDFFDFKARRKESIWINSVVLGLHQVSQSIHAIDKDDDDDDSSTLLLLLLLLLLSNANEEEREAREIEAAIGARAARGLIDNDTTEPAES